MNQKLTYLPTKDEIFKRLFGSIGNEQIAKSFIEGILDIKIQSVTLDHKLELPREHPKNKKMVADVIIKDEQGRKYILEMQRKEYPGILKRFFGYTCKVYVSEVKVKEDYNKLKKTLLLLIMEEPIPELKCEGNYHSVIELTLKRKLEIDFSYITELHIIELSKYKKYRKNGGEIKPWIEFLVNPLGKELSQMARTNQELRAAVEKLKELNSDEEVRWIAEMEEWHEFMRQDEMRCMREEAIEQGLKQGVEQGMKQGVEQGMKQGMKQGMEQGMKDGEMSKAKAIAKKMLKNNLKIDEISEYTGLSKEDIEKLEIIA